MSTKLVEQEIARFLASPDPEVLCLRGKWGVGKTYSWNRFLQQAQEHDGIALKTYSYVSLFGVGSLDQFRYAIFENSIGTENVSVTPSLETLSSNTAGVTDRLGRKAWSILQHMPKVKDFAAAVQALSFLSIRNTIVCVDDLERKGSGLSTRDVLGLIAQLRDQRGCKVVLILNEEQLEGSDKTDFDKYNEKVIDISVIFEPTAADCARIALTEATETNKLMTEHCIALGISNIRVIKKIERLVLRVAPLLNGFDDRVFKQAVQSLVLLAWAVHSANDALLEFVTTNKGRRLFGTTDEDGATDQEKEWDALLDRYGFRMADEFDLTLLSGVQNGFFDEEKLTAQATILDAQFKAVSAGSALEAAWRLYHDSFDDNEAEVSKDIRESLLKNVLHVTPNTLSAAVQLLRDLGHEDWASEAIADYMRERKEDRAFFDLSRQTFGEDIRDPEVRKAFEARAGQFEDKRDPAEVLIKIGERQGWGPSDIALLSTLSADDFYAMFKRLKGDALNDAVQTSLQFARIGGLGEKERAISERATEALKRIGTESPLNRRRVRKYGIIVEAEAASDGGPAAH